MTTYIPLWTTKLVREDKLAVPDGASGYVSCPSDAYTLLRSYVEGEIQENLWVILVNTKRRAIGVERVYRGSLDTCQVRVAEVMRPAILAGASAIIVAHNHPSGDTTPSRDDMLVTKSMVKAGDLLGIDVLDHLVISDEGFTSMKEKFGGCWSD